jgi:hypothetical protein
MRDLALPSEARFPLFDMTPSRAEIVDQMEALSAGDGHYRVLVLAIFA